MYTLRRSKHGHCFSNQTPSSMCHVGQTRTHDGCRPMPICHMQRGGAVPRYVPWLYSFKSAIKINLKLLFYTWHFQTAKPTKRSNIQFVSVGFLWSQLVVLMRQIIVKAFSSLVPKDIPLLVNFCIRWSQQRCNRRCNVNFNSTGRLKFSFFFSSWSKMEQFLPFLLQYAHLIYMQVSTTSRSMATCALVIHKWIIIMLMHEGCHTMKWTAWCKRVFLLRHISYMVNTSLDLLTIWAPSHIILWV